MTSQTGLQIVTINILSNISRRKGKQKIKFDQFIKYDVRNIFLQKSSRKSVRETSSRLFFLFLKILYKSNFSAYYFQHILVVMNLDIK